MISAFGVEHGDEEIAKFDAAGILKPLKSAFSATQKFGEGLKSGYKFKPVQPGKGLATTSKPTSAFGRGNAVGSAIGANKGLSAGIAGGGVAAGAGGYAMGNRKRY